MTEPIDFAAQQPGESRANWKNRTFGLHYGAGESDFFRCASCNKVHMKLTGKVCPCGEPFPYEWQEKEYRTSE